MKYIHTIFFILLIASCSPNNAEKEMDDANIAEANEQIVVNEQQFASAQMALGKIETHDFYDYIQATGYLEVPPHQKAEVSAYYGGYVQSMKLIPGEWVNKGQVLFTLENPEFIEAQQAYLEVKSQVEFLREDFKRQRILAEEDIVSKKKYQQAKASYDLVKNQMGALRKRLQMMKINPNSVSASRLRSTIAITAPISGYINRIDVSQGQFLSTQDVAVEINNTNHIYLMLNVFEKDLNEIEKGMPVDFTVNDDPNQQYEAAIKYLSKSVNPATRSIEVHCDIDAPESVSFSAGMFADAKIKKEVKTLKALPREAVLEQDGERVILINIAKENEKYIFEKKVIETGEENEDYVEIKTPIPEDAFILTQGGFQLVQ